jgi:hypothetical protein
MEKLLILNKIACPVAKVAWKIVSAARRLGRSRRPTEPANVFDSSKASKKLFASLLCGLLGGSQIQASGSAGDI